VSEAEKNRLIAWNRELISSHRRLRQALRLTRDALDTSASGSAGADLMLYCHGFCAALRGHHVSEDAALFPELSARHPELRSTIAKLAQDHGMIASLITQLENVLASPASPAEISLQLDGLTAIMESHFSYEERQLLEVLSTLDLAADPHTYLGPL
jgi:hemerythrin-like domain-containing protein